MHRIAPFLLAGVLTLAPSRGWADVAYEFNITTAFAASDPFPDRIDTEVSGTDTGYLQIANSGPGDYSGLITIVLQSAYSGVETFTLDNVSILSGASVSIGLPGDSSQAGGFNSFNGSNRAGTTGQFSVGTIIYLQGDVGAPNNSAAIKIAVQDLDITTGDVLLDPSGFDTGSFVLQGGDPFGYYNGDTWELDLPEGHYTFEGTAIPEPPPLPILAAAMAGLLLVRHSALARPIGSPVYSLVASRRRVNSCPCPPVHSPHQGSPRRFRASIRPVR